MPRTRPTPPATPEQDTTGAARLHDALLDATRKLRAAGCTGEVHYRVQPLPTEDNPRQHLVAAYGLTT